MAKENKKKVVKLNFKFYEFTDSSTIAKLEYDKEQLVMRTTFKSGKTYEYKGVPKETFRDIRRAESVGSAHHKLIVASGFEGKIVEK